MGDLVEDRSAESPFEAALTALLPSEIARLFVVLDERNVRFSVSVSAWTAESRALEQVGVEFNLPVGSVE